MLTSSSSSSSYSSQYLQPDYFRPLTPTVRQFFQECAESGRQTNWAISRFGQLGDERVNEFS